MSRLKKWSEWSQKELGYIPIRDLGSPDDLMTKKQFNDSLFGQTLVLCNNCRKLSTEKHKCMNIIKEQAKQMNLLQNELKQRRIDVQLLRNDKRALMRMMKMPDNIDVHSG